MRPTPESTSPTAADAFAVYRRWLAAHLIVTAPQIDTNRKKAA